MTLREVLAWACANGHKASFREAYRSAVAITGTRLLRSLQREKLAQATLAPLVDGSWCLVLGSGPKVVANVTPPGTLGFWEVLGTPIFEAGETTRSLATVGAWTRALASILRFSMSELATLCEGFQNSVANLTLNAMLALTRNGDAPEPASRGHFLYPLPGLRVGPSPAMVARCSNLAAEPSPLAFLVVSDATRWSSQFSSLANCWRRTLGVDLPDVAIPLHPWQWQLSPLVQSLLELGIARRIEVPDSLVWPLASQRTCRIVKTGYDLKLAVNATITGEQRLLYRAHVANACAVSELIARLSEADGTVRAMGCAFQLDVAAVAHPDEVIGPHVSAIVRAPLPPGPGIVVPALALWETVSSAGPPDLDPYAFYYEYCRLTIGGPLVAYARWGLALEPHVQNVLIRCVNGYPTEAIIRDLDATILCSQRVPAALCREGLELGCAEWSRFPSYEDGRDRLAHSLVHANLAIAEATLARRAGVEPARLVEAEAAAWQSCYASLTRDERRAVDEVRARAAAVKALLRMRLRNSTRMEFAA